VGNIPTAASYHFRSSGEKFNDFFESITTREANRIQPAMKRLLLALLFVASLHAQHDAVVDTDHDGLTDSFEQSLLKRFAPTFMVSRTDCSTAPALFVPNEKSPTVSAENNTIYGQVFPAANHRIEIHYYHLWRIDCGRMGHALDTEHVSVLLASESPGSRDASQWQALYWYAAAHEDTVCDASQITRACTLDATDHGPTVWISAGKHGSFLAEELCRHGCGGDTCGSMAPLAHISLVNLGESGHPMNGASFISSAQWPLTTKMTRSDLRSPLLSRVDRLPDTDIAWANPSRRPAQATIAAGVSTSEALALSDRKTNTALVVAGNNTGSALGVSYRSVKSALGKSVHSVARALGKKDASAK
jgi:hypothetical protein